MEKLRTQHEEEQDRRLAERHAAYSRMIDSIQRCPVFPSQAKAPKATVSFLRELKYSPIPRRPDMDRLGSFVALDTETTGLKSSSDEIIEIAAVRFRSFQPVELFSTLLAPRSPIPAAASAVNHITDEMVQGKPCFQQVAGPLTAFIGSDDLVGHNLPFDLKFMVHYGAGITAQKRKYYDTLGIAQKTIKKVKMKWDRELQDYIEDFESDGVSDYTLKTLCFYLGIIHEDTHRAEGDALAAGFLFHKLVCIRQEKIRAQSNSRRNFYGGMD